MVNPRLMQALFCLLSNAIKYSPLHDTVTLNMEIREHTVRVTVTALHD
jgi:signal transduction histidine kinase